MSEENNTILRQRQLVLSTLLGRLDAYVADLPAAGLVTSTATRSFTRTHYQADRESWRLLQAGVTCLQKATGSIAGAVTASSLRNSALAAGLGLPAPQFETVRQIEPQQDGHAQALFLVRRWLEALAADTKKSHGLIARALHARPVLMDDAAANKLALSESQRFLAKLAECHTTNDKILRDMVSNLPLPTPKPHSGNFDF